MWRKIRSGIFILVLLPTVGILVAPASESFSLSRERIATLPQSNRYQRYNQTNDLTRVSLPSVILPQKPTTAPVETPSPPGDSKMGEDLFTGRTHLINSGPPCISCHAVSGIPFPNGGTMGPDLTGVYKRFGPEGMAAALDTLFFVTMQPLYDNRPLTPAEQRNLAAFLKQAESNQPRLGITAEFGLISVAGCAGLFVLNGVIWKNRLRVVRRSLIAQVRKQRG